MRGLTGILIFLTLNDVLDITNGTDTQADLRFQKPTLSERTSRHAVRILQNVGIGLIRSDNAENVVIKGESWYSVTIDFPLPSFEHFMVKKLS